MVQIPTFESGVPIGPTPAPQASVSAAEAPGEALAHLGNVMTNEGLQWEQSYSNMQRATDLTDRATSGQKRMSDAATKWSHYPNQAQAQAGFQAEAQQIYDDTMSGVIDPQERVLLGRSLKTGASILYGDVGRQSFRLEASKKVGQTELDINDLYHQYASATSDVERHHITDLAHQQIESRVATGLMPGEAAAQLFIRFRQRADAAHAMLDIDANPQTALQKLNNPANYPNIDEFTRGRLIARAESKSQRYEAVSRGDVRQRFDDNVASLESTGEEASPLSDNEIKAAFPAQADQMLGRLHLAGALYQAKQVSTLTNPQQDQELLDKWAPKGPGFADQEQAQGVLEKTLAAKYTALRRDPAAYVLSVSPEISQQFQAAAQDPTKMRSALASLDAAYDQLGLPLDQRRLFSEDASAKLASSITSNPDQAQATIKGLQGEFGSYWPRAWRDIVQVGKLPSAYQALTALDNPRDAAELARWLGQKQNEKQESDLLGVKTVTSIKNALHADPGLQSLMSSLARSGSSSTQSEGLMSAIESLAFAKAYFDHDPNAAQDAASAFTSQYEFMPNGGARVPRAQYDQVKSTAATVLGALTLDKIMVPDVYGKEGMPKPEEFLDLVKSSPTWITSPHGDALWLMDPYGRFVRGRNGAPISVPFYSGAR